MTVILVAALVALVVVWVLARYNALVRLRTRLDNAWTQLDIQLRRRHALVAEVAQALAPHLRTEVEDALRRAEGEADAATSPLARAEAEAALVAAVDQAWSVAPPTADMAARFEALDAQVSHARAHYDATVRRYNTRRGPGLSALVARVLGAGPRALFSDPGARPVVITPPAPSREHRIA